MIVGQSGNRPTIPTKTRQIDYMHLKLLLPDVKTAEFSQPKKCPRAGCAGMRFYPRSFREACKTRTSGISREIVICVFVIFLSGFRRPNLHFCLDSISFHTRISGGYHGNSTSSKLNSTSVYLLTHLTQPNRRD